MSEVLFEVRNLSKKFRSGRADIWAVNDVSFTVCKGETLGIVGESGCGKTTCGRTVVGLYSRDGGQVLYKGQDVHSLRGQARAKFCREVQTIFQDPYSSLDSRNHVCDLIAEGMDIHKLCSSKEERLTRVQGLMEQVGLNQSGLYRYPQEFSGGMRQRIGIARALAVEPEFIFCDEPISALDVSIQAQIINLLMDLRETKGLTYMIISHDLSMMKHICDRILVMYFGRVVESCSASELYQRPLHPYTGALISAIPIADPRVERQRRRILLSGQVPNPSERIAGCAFASRCPHATDRCLAEAPELTEAEAGHMVACHRYTETNATADL